MRGGGSGGGGRRGVLLLRLRVVRLLLRVVLLLLLLSRWCKVLLLLWVVVRRRRRGVLLRLRRSLRMALRRHEARVGARARSRRRSRVPLLVLPAVTWRRSARPRRRRPGRAGHEVGRARRARHATLHLDGSDDAHRAPRALDRARRTIADLGPRREHDLVVEDDERRTDDEPLDGVLVARAERRPHGFLLV